MVRRKVLVVYNHNRTFINKDIELLKEHFDVKTYFYSKEKKFGKLRKLIKWSDVLYCWFASYHCLLPTFLANIYKKRKIIIVGGYDACDIKGYGIFSTWRGEKLAKYLYKHADKILVVDKSLKEDILKNTKLEIGEKIYVIPTGYDPEKWIPGKKKERMVLTVGFVDEINWWRKGIKTFVKAAELLPNIPFYVVGKIDEKVKSYIKNAPENVKFLGWVSDEELLQYYQRAKVYCQLSRYEGLPNVLCEAMLCECVPVGTKYCGIPTAIGDTGFYVPYGDEKATAEAIKKALEAPEELGKRARERIIKLFPHKMREKKLVEIIEGLKNDSK